MTALSVDLGLGHSLRFLCWHPDRDLNPQYGDVPDEERYAAIISHPLLQADTIASCHTRGWCESAIVYSGLVQQRVDPQHERWEVQAWEPMTLTPSLLCHCGDHGFITDGHWVSG